IWLKVDLFDRSSLKNEAQRSSEQLVHPPSWESPLKLQRHIVRLLAIRKLIPNAEIKFIAP
ncbi:MAG: hypothetical protein ACK56F_15895, partial [bacterium]